jgi:phosphoglycerate dehydrogenase-like enzyme
LTERVLIGEDVGEANVARLRAAFPDVDFRFVPNPSDLTDAAPDARIIFTKNLPPAALAAARNLVWVQAGIAGVDGMLANGMREHSAILTCARGAHGIPMAEHILAMMFALANRVQLLVEGRAARRLVGMRARGEKWELTGQTIVIVGLGDVGGTLAQKCQALGLRVIGVRRGETPFPGIAATHPTAALSSLLPTADHVALCLPGTAETRFILDASRIALLKSTSCVYNVGRGSAIDQDALIAALRDGRIGGAGLDVTTPEPLPTDSPLWDLPNVILGQHSSGHSPFNHDRITEIFADNLHRFLRGEALANVVDKPRGY